MHVCQRVVSPKKGWPPRAREATRCHIHMPDDVSSLLDDGLVTVFPAPHSYTGEDVVELGTHGGAFIPRAVCAALVEAGARVADPGEFTERAVLNGKLDLLRAEAVADLIDARSRAAHRTAIRQLSGSLTARLSSLRENLIGLEALIAYDIDFPEEDGGRVPRERLLEACDELLAQLEALLATVPAATLERDGATVVLAGPPNAGKSSLLNALVGETRVIVSDVAGTTRDAVEVLLDHEPWPLRLVDTAGLCERAELVERLGIEVSERYLVRANIVVACAPSGAEIDRVVVKIREWTDAPVVGAQTKSDLSPPGAIGAATTVRSVSVSAVNGEGLHELLTCVTTALIGAASTPDSETPLITRARHRAALTLARDELAAFRRAWSDGKLPSPVAAVTVRTARSALDELVGVVDVEDVFARVFSTFCIGK